MNFARESILLWVIKCKLVLAIPHTLHTFVHRSLIVFKRQQMCMKQLNRRRIKVCHRRRYRFRYSAQYVDQFTKLFINKKVIGFSIISTNISFSPSPARCACVWCVYFSIFQVFSSLSSSTIRSAFKTCKAVSLNYLCVSLRLVCAQIQKEIYAVWPSFDSADI